MRPPIASLARGRRCDSPRRPAPAGRSSSATTTTRTSTRRSRRWSRAAALLRDGRHLDPREEAPGRRRRYAIEVDGDQRDEYPQVLTRVDIVHVARGDGRPGVGGPARDRAVGDEVLPGQRDALGGRDRGPPRLPDALHGRRAEGGIGRGDRDGAEPPTGRDRLVRRQRPGGLSRTGSARSRSSAGTSCASRSTSPRWGPTSGGSTAGSPGSSP